MRMVRQITDLITRRRALFAALFALAAAGCMALSAYHFRPQERSLAHYRPTQGGPESYYSPAAPWWLIAGALLLVIALLLVRRIPTAPRRTRRPLDALRPRWAWVLVAPGGVTLLVLAEANAHWIGWSRVAGLSPVGQLALFGAGIAGVVLGLGGMPFARRSSAGPYRPSPLSPSKMEKGGVSLATRDIPPLSSSAGEGGQGGEVFLLLLLTLAALALRLYQLGDSIHVLVDEAHFVLGVNYARMFPDLRLLEPMPTTASFPFLFSYGQKLAVDVFGRNLLGLRALSAILGALTIPATYFLGRQLFDRTTALTGALVLLAFPPHIHYSRLALNNIADPLFGTLALAFLGRGLRFRRRFDWALGGVCLGLAQYFYEGGRLIYPALAAAWLVFGWAAWRPRAPLRGMVIAALAFVLVAAPMYYTLLGVDFPLTDRMDKAAYGQNYWAYEREQNNLETRARHFVHALMHIINGPENTVFHYYLYYGGAHPLVQEWLVPLLLLGTVIALWRWWEPGILLPGTVIATAAGNALLVESAVTARYVVAFPALALLIAVGLRHTLAIMVGGVVYAKGGFGNPPLQDTGRAARALAAVTLLIAAGIAVGQAAYYFGPHLDRFNDEVREYPDADADDAILRAAELPPRTFVHLVGIRILPQRDAQHFMDFLADGISVQVHTPDTITPEFLAALRRDVNHAFFVAPYGTDTLALLASTFGPRPLLRTANPRVPDHKAMPLYWLPADPAAPPAPPGMGAGAGSRT